ncbi:MAG: shikimate kinase [Oscillospiraceae bacterium]|nr:shikimate kinase [Oscillospiraceae bacterium]
MRNIVLIGMPACGKSTIGVLLAKSLGFEFIDTDLIIQKQEGRLLQEIIDTDGLDAFCIAEERAIISVTEESNAIIATGGSAVYSRTAMLHLKRHGLVYYLALPEKEIEKRLYNITSRGIAMRRGETIEEVFARRRALYEEYGDIAVDCGGKSMEEIVAEITDCHRAAELT